MADQTIDDEVIKRSSTYQEFLAEREEIMKHKWLCSESAGHDIGFDTALVDWTINHRSEWKKKRKKSA